MDKFRGTELSKSELDKHWESNPLSDTKASTHDPLISFVSPESSDYTHTPILNLPTNSENNLPQNEKNNLPQNAELNVNSNPPFIPKVSPFKKMKKMKKGPRKKKSKVKHPSLKRTIHTGPISFWHCRSHKCTFCKRGFFSTKRLIYINHVEKCEHIHNEEEENQKNFRLKIETILGNVRTNQQSMENSFPK